MHDRFWFHLLSEMSKQILELYGIKNNVLSHNKETDGENHELYHQS